MTDVNSTPTSLKDAINIGLSCLGETPVSAPDNTSTNVVLAKQIIEEVSRDVQSKGWWFNTSGSDISILGNSGSGATENFASTGGTNNAGIPEEARRYIAIRAARVLQSRFVGSEELLKFSFQEEQVSLAVLTQAHVRNGGDSTSFNSFPADLKGMGVEEVLFLQQSAEEKLLSLRLVTELKSGDKLAAETALIADQEDLVEQQVLTEVEETAKRTAEKGLVDAQATDVAADTTLKGKQGDLVDAQKSQVQTETVLKSQQALTELENTNLIAQNAIKTAAESGLVTTQQALIAQQVLDVVADTALKTKQGLKIDGETALVEAQEELTDAQKATEIQNAIKVAADAGLVTTQQALIAQQVLESVANVSNITADVALKGKQSTLVEKQALDVEADTSLKGKQGTKIDAETGLTTQQQALIAQQTLDVVADTDLKTSQKTQLDVQTALQGTAEKAFFDNGGVVIDGSAKTYRDFAAEMRMMGFQETQFQGMPAYKKVELIKDANKLRTATTTTETGTDATELLEVNKVMRFIGESPVSALNSNSLASECVRLLRDTDTELQGRGWYFNIDADDVIVPKSLVDTPQKYREYLSVRVAILLTELYPQSGIDIQRLPKMEAELRAYFKDREADDANYSVFDNYDTASRIGINRNYDIS